MKACLLSSVIKKCTISLNDLVHFHLLYFYNIDVYKRQGSGSYKFTLTAILLINDKTGVIESAELVSSGPSDCSCLYNIDAYDYEVYFTVTVYDHNIFGNIDHALVTQYYTVKTPGIMR